MPISRFGEGMAVTRKEIRTASAGALGMRGQQ